MGSLAVTGAAALCAPAGPAGAQDCAPARLLTPAAGEVLGDARVLLALAPQGDRTGTRAMAEIRAPEKAVLQRFDTEVRGDIVRLPSLVSLYRADINVALYARCGSSTARVAETRFHIDTGLACAAPAGIGQTAGELRWTPGPAANGTEVALLDAADLREIRRATVQSNAMQLPAAGDIVAVLRSRCGEGESAPAFARVRIPTR